MMKRIFFLLIFLGVGLVAQAQRDGSAKSKIKKAEHKKEERLKNNQKSEIEGRKRHEGIQTKAVRKRIRKHRQQRIHVDAYERKPSFLKRWFHKKEHGS